MKDLAVMFTLDGKHAVSYRGAVKAFASYEAAKAHLFEVTNHAYEAKVAAAKARDAAYAAAA